MNKKACIVTLYSNNNYGNKLQNYAVQTVLEKKDFDVESLKLYPGKFKKNGFIYKVLNRLIWNIKLNFFKVGYKNKNFKKFYKSYMKMNKNKIIRHENHKYLANKYDYFIVGSDQVWNPYFGLDYDLEFLEFSNKEKNIAFSASIGVSEIPEEKKEKYIKGINNIKYLSLREDKGKNIVKELTGREDAIVLVDPTMLLTREEWKKVAKKPEQLGKEKYILNYFLGELSEERKSIINNLAQKNGWKIINILDPNDPFYDAGPSEFVYLEENAELICTDSFHSCVFGILMNTPFEVFIREDEYVSMNSRLETLLSKFGLENRYYRSGELNEEHLKCDYTNAYKVLEDERKKANDFLNKALDIE